MSLQTWEEEEVLRKVRDLDHRLRRVEAEIAALTKIAEAILALLPKTYHAPAGLSFVAAAGVGG